MSLSSRVRNAKIKAASPKVLVFDIERLPGLAKVWSPRTDYIAPRNFVEWPSLLCLAGRWYGSREMMFSALWEQGGHEAMVRTAWQWLNDADVVVGWNSQKFDVKHLRTDFLQLGLKPPLPFKQVDLFRVVRAQFGFESASLDSVTRRLGRGGKSLSYSMDLAQACVDGDERAQRRMQRYNSADVELTEWVYDRLRGWLPAHPILGALSEELVCNQCGSDQLTSQPTLYRAILIDYAMFRCGNCGGLIRGASHSRAAGSRGVL